MKIAILISGEYRTFPICRKTMTFLDDPRTDIYVSTWNQSNYINRLINLNITESVSHDNIKSDLGKSATIEIEDPAVITVTKYNTQMIHRWKRGIKLIKDSEIEYDYILVTRPDLIFNNAIPAELPDLEKYKDAVGFSWAIDLSTKKLADVLFLGSSKSIIELIDNINIDEWCNGSEHNWHIWWYNYVTNRTTIRNAPELSDLIFCRYWCNTTNFSEAVDIHDAWRDSVLLWQLIKFGRPFVSKNWTNDIIDNAIKNRKLGLYNKYYSR